MLLCWALQGDMQAQHTLGMLYLNGELGIQSFDEARYWLQRAADQDMQERVRIWR
jgi:TPR repeat protein